MAPSASPKLDVLRSVAVLTVVGSHIWFERYPVAVLGRMGVLLFFIHTSLVLMFSLERQFAIAGRHRLWTAFMLKRVFRIYPLAMVVVGVTFAFEIPAYAFLDDRIRFIPIDHTALVSHLALTQDAILSNGRPGPMMGVLWTLPVELRMYLFLPLIFLVVRKMTDLRLLFTLWTLSVPAALGANWTLERLFGTPAMDLGAITVRVPRLAEFIPHFLAGVLAYVLWHRMRFRLPFAALPALLAPSLLGYYLLADQIGQSVVLNLFGMLACLAIGVALPAIAEPAWRPLTWAAAELARLSYAIYLVHVPMIWFATESLDGLPVAVQWLVMVAGTILLSAALHAAIERPFIQIGAGLSQRLLERRRSAGAGQRITA